MKMAFPVLPLFLLFFTSAWAQDATMHVQSENKTVAVYGRRLGSVDKKFLSVAIDTNEIRWNFRGLDFGSKKLQSLAAALSPTNLRLGGTDADFLQFDADMDDSKFSYPKNVVWEKRYEKSHEQRLKDGTNFTMTGKQWSYLTDFAKLVGMDMMFDVNVLQFRSDGLWDYRNVQGLLNYSAARQIPIPTFQLGNEPDLFYHINITIPGDIMAKNFAILRGLLDHYGLFHTSDIVGPDVTSVRRNYRARSLLSAFLKAGGQKSLTSVGLHQYYLSGETATINDFMDPTILDYMKGLLNTAESINAEYPPRVSIQLTETASCYGGGSTGLSDRYVAGFLWLDKLGLSAQYGVKAVYRQSFYGGSYALLTDDCDPRPDYFMSVLYKRLVEGSVFYISVAPASPDIRVYANCARRDFYNYPRGAIVVYFLNLRTSSVNLTLEQFKFNSYELFLLTPGDSDGLKSKYVSLNGKKLEMSGNDLPKMSSVKHQGDIPMAAQSFGFIVIPDADEGLCA